MLRTVLPLLLAGAIGIFGGIAGGGGPGRAEAPGETVTVTLDMAGGREMARRALQADRPDIAITIARQMLTIAPLDTAAHLLLAAALTRAGTPEEAVPFAKAGYRLATDDDTRYEAAYVTAEALAAAGRTWAAKFWLRRADNHSDDPVKEAILIGAYGNVSKQSRLSFDFSVFGGPSENVNGGSLHEYFYFFGIPIPVAQALPGFTYGGSVSATWRLTDRSSVKLSWAHKSVVLGERARAIDPGAEAGDFAQDEVGLSYAQSWAGEGARPHVALTLTGARRWEGGRESADLWRAEAGLSWTLSERTVLVAEGLLEDARNLRRSEADSVTRRLTFGVKHARAGIGLISAGVGAKEVDSRAAGIAWRGPVLALGWRPDLPGDALELDLSLGAELRDYWRTPSFDPDRSLSLSATAGFGAVEFMGFSPSVTLAARRTWSQVVVRDTMDVGLSVGLSSKF